MVNTIFDNNFTRVSSFVELDRHKSIYHQPSLTKYNGSERRRKHRRRSQPHGDTQDVRTKSFTSSDSCDIGKKKKPVLISV